MWNGSGMRGKKRSAGKKGECGNEDKKNSGVGKDGDIEPDAGSYSTPFHR